jgi:hypothetical protein
MMRRNQIRQRKLGKRKKNKNNVRRPHATIGSVLKCRMPIADSTIVPLMYQDTSLVKNNVGGLVCSWRYRMNSVYDPDPLLGSGSVSSYNEWAAFYTHYRVLAFKYDITVANNETFAVIIVCAPTATDVGANYSGTIQLSEVPYGKKNMLSAKTGSDRCHIAGEIQLNKFEGIRGTEYDQSYASTIATNPSNIRFFNIGYAGGSICANGVVVSIKLTYLTEFYARYPIIA